MHFSILSVLLLWLGFQSNFLSSVACSGHHHHHHHAAEEEQNELQDSLSLSSTERRLQSQKVLDAMPCASMTATRKEKREAGKALQEWKNGIASGRRGWWNRDGSNGNGKRNTRRLDVTQYLIPVSFHVLRMNDGSGDVSTSKINQYLDYLNEAFVGTPFQFYRRRITRTNNSVWHSCNYDTHNEAGAALRKGGVADMNVYFCTLSGSGGFAYFPYGSTPGAAWDGIVIESDYTKYGFPSSYTRRTVLPHEAGHWFGLHHTFEDGCDATYTTRYGWPAAYAQFNGDGVADTPAHLSSSRDCSLNLNSCSDTTPGVDPGPDPTDNYMSYANDSCQIRFTQGQIERMTAMFEFYRYDQSVVVGTTASPTDSPTTIPTVFPTTPPTDSPTTMPTDFPTTFPTDSPLAAPVASPPSYCINDDTWRDTGCLANQNNGAKVCVLANNMEPAVGSGGDKCVACVNHKTDFSQDRGCTLVTPICVMNDGTTPAPNTAGDKCAASATDTSYCINDSTWRDTGCLSSQNNGNKVCATADGSNPVDGQGGTQCVVCINTRDGDGLQDTGCSLSARHCVDVDGFNAPLNKAGVACVETPSTPSSSNCVNDNAWRDTGCPAHRNAGAKVCVYADNTEPASGQYGDKCVQCVNHMEVDRDRGCPSSTPICVLNDGSSPGMGLAGDKCAVAAVGGPACINDSAWRDSGCPANQNNGNKVCATAAGSDPVFGESGTQCVACINSIIGPNLKDMGCPSSARHCVLSNGFDPPLGQAGVSCAVTSNSDL